MISDNLVGGQLYANASYFDDDGELKTSDYYQIGSQVRGTFFGFEFENGSVFSEGEGNGYYFKLSDPERPNETFSIDYSYSYHPYGLSGDSQYITGTVELTTDNTGFGRSEAIRS